jgi:hypothetical protein
MMFSWTKPVVSSGITPQEQQQRPQETRDPVHHQPILQEVYRKRFVKEEAGEKPQHQIKPHECPKKTENLGSGSGPRRLKASGKKPFQSIANKNYQGRSGKDKGHKPSCQSSQNKRFRRRSSLQKKKEQYRNRVQSLEEKRKPMH